MRQLSEMREVRPMELHGSVVSTTADVWEMLRASRDGHLDQVRRLIERCPALRTCQYDYTSPLHFAVREGHFHLVRYLVEQGAPISKTIYATRALVNDSPKLFFILLPLGTPVIRTAPPVNKRPYYCEPGKPGARSTWIWS